MRLLSTRSIKSIFSSTLEEDLDHPLNHEDEDATTSRGAPIFANYSDLKEEAEILSNDHLDLIIASLQGRLVF